MPCSSGPVTLRDKKSYEITGPPEKVVKRQIVPDDEEDDPPEDETEAAKRLRLERA